MEKNEILYSQNQVPPVGKLIFLSLQQAVLILTTSILPAIFIKEISGDIALSISFVSVTLIVSGIGSILQGFKIKGFGSGYLCPNVCGPSYFSLSLQAFWMGGFPLMRGMIIFAGIIEMALAPVVKYLRNLFPPVVVGIVVANVGISIIPLIFANFCGSPYSSDIILWQDVATAIVTLLLITSLNIWGKGNFKLFCLLIGISIGWLLYILIIPSENLNYVSLPGIPMFAIPRMPFNFFELQFNWSLMFPFLIISLCGSLKTFGNLAAAQKITTPEITEMDMKPIAGGLWADGFTTSLSGVLGAMAVDTSSGNVGLAAATKAVSRWIGIVAGIMVLIAGFFTRISLLISIIPPPVVGAALTFAIVFMVITGFQEIFSVKLDQKKIAVVGLSIIFSLCTQFVPELFAYLPKSLQIIFSNSLTSSTLLAILLYQFFHLDNTYALISKKLRLYFS
jgi:NCS2 family nucleobase:cation symporter-2